MISICSNIASFFKIIILSLIGVGAFSSSNAQKQILFSQLSVENGLSQNSVVSITQDSTGYMWFATQDGLNKYDGKKFTYYPKLFVDITRDKFSKLGKVYLDKSNTLWIIPINGIPEKMDAKNGTFTAFPKVKEASSFYQYDKLNLWIGTFGNGLYRKNLSTEGVTQVIEKGFPDIYSLFTKDDNHILVGADAILLQINRHDLSKKEVLVFDANGNKVVAGFSSFAKDANGTIWLGTFGSGLFYKTLKDSSFRQFVAIDSKTQKPLPNKLNILSLLIDKKNRLWVGTFGDGAWEIDEERKVFQNFRANKYNSKAIHQNDVLSLYEDYTGTIWLGTDGGGLSYYDENLNKFDSRTTTQIANNSNIDYVRAITSDKAGNMWLGTFNKGLSSYDSQKEEWKTYLPETSDISSKRIVSLLRVEDELWIGTNQNGLNILKDNRFEKFNDNTAIKLSAATINCMFKDAKNKIWLGTQNNGLILFDKEKGMLKQYLYESNKANGIPSNNISVIHEDEYHKLWIGTANNGFSEFNSETGFFKNFKASETDSNSLSSDKIKSIYYASNDVLWVGTNGGGLNAFDLKSNRVYRYNRNDGLPNDVVYAILPDEIGNLWISSNKGISKVKMPEQLGKKLSITNYDISDGLQSLEFNTGAYFKDSKGYLYFGGLNGYNWINPKEISTNSTAPKTVINQVEIFNKVRPLIQESQFKSSENTISFTFSALHFSQPKNNRYQYKLVNHDEEWINAGNKSYANYTNLAPGSYTFLVKSANYDGVWNNESAIYQFTILKPWYLTNLAWFIYLLLFLLLCFGVYVYFKWRWTIKMKLRVELEETKRLKEIDSFKNKFFENISHEFRTPLTLIKLPISQAINNKQNLTQEHLEIIDNNTNQLQKLIEDLLLISELEAGKGVINKTEQNPLKQIETLSAQFNAIAKDKGISYTKQIEKTQVIASYDKSVVDKVMTNLISNAIKYSRKGDAVEVIAGISNRNLVIAVKDTGEGISQENKAKIFDRFFQVDQNKEQAAGSGIGLSLVKKIVALNKGSISVESELNKGSLFKVIIPLENIKEEKDVNEEIVKNKKEKRK